MNCQEANRLLENADGDALSPRDRAAVDRHMSSCANCAGMWADWREVAALAVPATPKQLGPRIIAAMLAARPRHTERRRRRATILGTLLVAGAAAAVIGLNSRDTEPDSDAPQVEAGTDGAPVSAGDATRPAAARNADDAGTGADSEPLSNDAPAEAAAAGYALDPLSIAVLERPGAAAGADTIEDLGSCHDAIVAELRRVAGLNIIADDSVAPYDETDLSNDEIARALGAGKLLVIDPLNGCNARMTESATGALVTGHMNGSPLPREDGWERFAAGFAAAVGDEILKDTATVVAEAKARILDTSLDDRLRAAAMNDLFDGRTPVPGAFDSAVVTAAAQLGMSSPDAGARESAWANLRGIDDPYLIEPLLQSLANDAERDVRMQAALTLNTFIDEPGVRDALLRAAAEDPDAEATVVCCIRTVREAAEYAAIATDNLSDWARRKLLDETLPSRSRLLPIVSGSPDGRFVRLLDLGEDAPAVVFDIGRNASDSTIRQLAWSALARAPRNESFVPVLIDDLGNHPYEYVRSNAATALRNYADDPEVRAALERAENDTSVSVRRAAMTALSRTNP